MKRGSITIGIIAEIGVPLFLAGAGKSQTLCLPRHNTDVKDINAELRQKGEVISDISDGRTSKLENALKNEMPGFKTDKN